MQSTGAKAEGKIVSKAFSDDLDVVEIEFASAYDVPTLKSLTRKFEYGRATGADPGYFQVTDEAQFEEGKTETFEDAIVTFEQVEIEQNGNALVIKIGDAVVNVSAKAADGSEQKLIAETSIVGENDDAVVKKPTRVALKVEGAVNYTAVTQRFEVAK